MNLIEAGNHFVQADAEDWDQHIPSLDLASGKEAHFLVRRDIAEVVVIAGEDSSLVTINHGMKPLRINTFGIVSQLSPLNEVKKCPTLGFELKGEGATVVVIAGFDSEQTSELVIKNLPTNSKKYLERR